MTGTENHSEYWSKGPIILLFMRLLIWEAMAEHGKRRGDVTIFPGALGVRLMLTAGMLIFAWTILRDWGQEDAWVDWLSVVIVAVMALGWPSTVWLTQAGVEQTVMANKAGDKAVFGKFGQSIGLTRYYADPVGFEFEVRRRAKLKETLDASAPLTLGLEEHPHTPVGLQGGHKATRKERKLGRIAGQ